MLRRQVYLTERQGRALEALARAKGRSQSELIRDAVDALLAKAPRGEWKEAWLAAAGMWEDYPEVEEIIREGRERLRRRETRLWRDS
jgi:Arc/MetJ-type ribon-helix-helix transcriptional regulator